MKLAKNVTRNHPAIGGVVMLIGALVTLPVFTGTSEAQTASQDNELVVEVLSVSVSKLARDHFGKSVNPFTFLGAGAGESGTVVFSKITPRGSSPLKLLEQKCRFLSFKDDVGTVLYTNVAAELGNPIFAGNRPLEIFATSDPGYFGLKIRSARVPAPTANRLTAEVLLVFSRSSEERAAQESDVLVQTNEVVAVGPLEVRFTGQPPNSYKGTLHMLGGLQPPYWVASFLPKKDATVASVAFFSNKSDEPILVVKNVKSEANASNSKTGIYNNSPHTAKSPDNFSNLDGYGFNPPANRKIAIKVRYYEVGSLVEKHCVISTGLSP